MNISGIGKGFNIPVPLGGAGAAERGESASVASGSSAATVSGSASATFRDILANYDVHEITPRDFTELVQKLRDAGEITEADAKELSLVRLALDQENIDPNEPIDLIDFFQQRLVAAQQQIGEQQLVATADGTAPPETGSLIGPIRRQLDWLQKLAVIHAEQGVDAFDARA